MTTFILWALGTGAARAEEESRVAVSVGYAGLAGSASSEGEPVGVGGFGSGYLSFRLHDHFALDVGGREGLVSAEPRVVGAVQVGARYEPTDLLFLRAGFVHHHETPWDAFRHDAFAATFGASEGIHHRTGGDLGMGLSFALPTGSRPVHTSLEVSAAAFPDENGPTVYGVVQQLFTVDLGRPKAP